MADHGMTPMPPSLREYSRRASIIGVGETNYASDYAAERKRAEGWEPPSIDDLCKLAFDRAVADAGIDASEIDALALHYTFGGPEPDEMVRHLGISPEKAWGPCPTSSGGSFPEK
jgi:hypothetical protein